jgi:hypothetical protein
MRYRTLLDSYGAELGGTLSEADASMQLRIEQMQAQIVEGRDVDADQIIRLSSEHRRLLTTLRGKAAKSKASGAAALQEYIARRAAEKAANAPDGGVANTKRPALSTP